MITSLANTRITRVIGGFFNKGHERTRKAQINIILSILTRVISIGTTLVMVPLTLKYLDSDRYGIWVTLSGVVQWLGNFDVGLGNGLRNNFTEALAKGERQLVRSYVSTTYASLSLLISFFVLVFFCVNPFLSWAHILNAPPIMEAELNRLAIIVFLFFCGQMVLQLISVVYTADQKPAVSSLMNCLINVITLGAIYILTKVSSGSLLYLGIIISAAPIVIYVIFSVFSFSFKYREFVPTPSFVNFKYARKLVGLGSKFFIIQMCMILAYQVTNIIVSQLFGPATVTPMSIADKYFGVLMIISSIIMFPFWSAFTEAYVKNDIDWIKKTIRQLKMVFYALVLMGLCMLVVSKWVFRLWVGPQTEVSWAVCVVILMKYLVMTLNNVYNFFINGVGKLKVQLIAYVTIGVVNIPLSILLGKYFGVAGAIFSVVLLMSGLTLIIYIQYKKIIESKAHGIWNE
jgi:O-antigen/teichoic acid export membrane protein